MEIISLKVLSYGRKLELLYSRSNGFPCIVEFVMQSCSPYNIVFLSSAMTKYEYTTNYKWPHYTENEYTSSKIQGPSCRPMLRSVPGFPSIYILFTDVYTVEGGDAEGWFVIVHLWQCDEVGPWISLHIYSLPMPD